MNSGVNYIFGNVPATGYAVTQAADPKIHGNNNNYQLGIRFRNF